MKLFAIDYPFAVPLQINYLSRGFYYKYRITIDSVTDSITNCILDHCHIQFRVPTRVSKCSINYPKPYPTIELYTNQPNALIYNTRITDCIFDGRAAFEDNYPIREEQLVKKICPDCGGEILILK